MITVGQYHAMPEGLRKGARLVDAGQNIDAHIVRTVKQLDDQYVVYYAGGFGDYHGTALAVQLPDMDTRMVNAGEAAIQAFWLVVAQAFPDARTLEADPVDMFVFEETANAAIYRWVGANVQSEKIDPLVKLDPAKIEKAAEESRHIRALFENAVSIGTGDTVKLLEDFTTELDGKVYTGDEGSVGNVTDVSAEVFFERFDYLVGAIVPLGKLQRINPDDL